MKLQKWILQVFISVLTTLCSHCFCDVSLDLDRDPRFNSVSLLEMLPNDFAGVLLKHSLEEKGLTSVKKYYFLF